MAAVYKHLGLNEESLRSGDSRIFISHGRSTEWRKVRTFITDDLGLAFEEFNREPVAGYTTIERLKNVLDTSSFALCLLTAEDQLPSGAARARENVVHELGLFQGRLGFNRAIVLLEEGCNEFSNILGLSNISFPKQHVEEKFQEITRVLEREGLVN